MKPSDKDNDRSSSSKVYIPNPEIISPKSSVGIAKMLGDIPDNEIFEGKKLSDRINL